MKDSFERKGLLALLEVDVSLLRKVRNSAELKTPPAVEPSDSFFMLMVIKELFFFAKL
jgi:hypothetical protein